MTSSTGSTARPDWDTTWLSVARTIARRSLCSRDQVGAVVVSATNRLLETGYNGPPSGFFTDNRPCSEWCPRASSEPTGWQPGPHVPADMSMEYELGQVFVKYAGGQIRRVASDETLKQLGFTPIFELAKDYSDCSSLHAEANALMRGDRTAREGGTIYVTSHVCMGCAKLIANSGLRDVVVAAQHDGAHREPEAVYRFLDKCGISVMIA